MKVNKMPVYGSKFPTPPILEQNQKEMEEDDKIKDQANFTFGT